jgi:hypothetical protein
MFTLPGSHPTYGTKLLPATPEAVAQYEKQKAEVERQRQAETQRKAKAQAAQKAKEERRRKIVEEVLLKRPLGPGRYLLPNPPPQGAIDGLRFALTEVDLTADKMLVHLNVDNFGVDPASEKLDREGGSVRLGLVLADGTNAAYTAIRAKEGALTERDGSFSFSPVGKRGAFVMEFPRADNPGMTFSVVVNDQPLFSGIDLRKATFQSF